MRFCGLRTFLYVAIFFLTAVPSANAAENMLSVDKTLIIQLVIFLAAPFSS